MLSPYVISTAVLLINASLLHSNKSGSHRLSEQSVSNSEKGDGAARLSANRTVNQIYCLYQMYGFVRDLQNTGQYIL